MQINKSTPLVGSNNVASTGQSVARADVASLRDDVAPAARADKVQFSAEALRLAQELTVEGEDALPEARRQEILDRIASGAYNTPELADHVARAIIGRSDL